MLHFYRAIREDLEYCFYIETRRKLDPQELHTLNWLLSETFEPDKFSPSSIIGNGNIIELGPRMNFETAYSTNAVAICHSCGLDSITRLERSRRYLQGKSTDREAFISANHDRMTESLYSKPLESFKTGIIPEKVCAVPILEEGTAALE